MKVLRILTDVRLVIAELEVNLGKEVRKRRPGLALLLQLAVLARELKTAGA